jgi:hypothetical protein
MPDTPTDIVNRALFLQGNKVAAVSGSAPDFDNSTAGIAAKWLYPEAVRTVGRLFEWDFARAGAILTLSGEAAPYPWAYEYLYPTDALQVWQLRAPSDADPFYPVPVNWVRANRVISGSQVSVIWTNQVNARAIYNNNPRPEIWSADFSDAVVRWLASAFAMALSGRPETQQNILTTATQMMQQGMRRQG